jgi:hypothetical protein
MVPFFLRGGRDRSIRLSHVLIFLRNVRSAGKVSITLYLAALYLCLYLVVLCGRTRR